MIMDEFNGEVEENPKILKGLLPNSKTKDESNKRDSWGSSRESFLVFLGYSVGIGNVWRFSYLAFVNGGGAFLIPYIMFAIFAGFPLYFLEVALGQYTKKSAIEMWNIVPAMKGIGYGSIILCFYSSMYYIMVLAWSVLYLGHSFTLGDLKWSTCGNWWNTNSCLLYSSISETHNNTILLNGSLVGQSNVTEGVYAISEFWQHYVLRKSTGIDDIGTTTNYPLLLSFFISWILVYGCCCKGASSAGKVVYVTATFPYIILTVLLVRGCTLPGAAEGVLFYIIPNMTKLAQAQVWVQAGSQVLYSYGICFAALVTFGSYNNYKTNCFRVCTQITFASSATSVYAGFSVFTVVGHLAYLQGKNVSDVIGHGPGLAFQTYPTAISLMPAPQVWGILFFLMLIMLGIDSQFTCVEAIISCTIDKWPKTFAATKRKRLLTLAVCVILALIGLPLTTGCGIYLFELYNNYAVSGFSLLILAGLESITIGHVYGTDRLYANIKDMIGYRPNPYVKYCYKFIAPVLILGILIFYGFNYTPLKYGKYEYPVWAHAFGWFTALSSIFWIPFFFIKTLYRTNGTWREKLCLVLRSEESDQKFPIETIQLKQPEI
uniref:Sodium- and chloride-dependent GABA transporter 2 n=1 Tax=Phallusia mammillata TaxID=59560 RepID=A0A6F9DTW4_9ASCI|nr:sodium- and chloride-dependent GABA transporter 2 [Phallusia mammillata]